MWGGWLGRLAQVRDADPYLDNIPMVASAFFCLHAWDLSEMAEMTNQNAQVVRGKANVSNYSSVMGKHQLTDSPSPPEEKLVVLQQSGSFPPGPITRLVCPMAFTEECYGLGVCRTSRGGGHWQQVRCPWKNCQWEEGKRTSWRSRTDFSWATSLRLDSLFSASLALPTHGDSRKSKRAEILNILN